MLTAFLIATLVIFIVNLAVALLTIAVVVGSNEVYTPIIPIINVFVCLGMITWNILALVSI